jgi:hypothetical protein
MWETKTVSENEMVGEEESGRKDTYFWTNEPLCEQDRTLRATWMSREEATG